MIKMVELHVRKMIKDPDSPWRTFLKLEDGTVVGPYLVTSAERVGVQIGSVYDEVVRVALSHADALQLAIEDAVSYLKRKARTESEVFRYLTKKCQYDESIALETLDWLKQYRAIDDGEFIRIAVSTAQNVSSSPSKRALTAKMRRRGIAKEQIAKVLQTHDYDEFKGALQVARRKLDHIERKLEKEAVPLGDRERKKKALLGAFLGRKGYTSATIHKVFDHLLD